MRGIEYEDVKYKLNLVKKITIIEIKQIQSIFHLGSKKIQQSDSQNLQMTWHCSRNSIPINQLLSTDFRAWFFQGLVKASDWLTGLLFQEQQGPLIYKHVLHVDLIVHISW